MYQLKQDSTGADCTYICTLYKQSMQTCINFNPLGLTATSVINKEQRNCPKMSKAHDMAIHWKHILMVPLVFKIVQP
jgi:hypothetical protein